MIRGKRGLSTIVATIALILLTIVAAGFIASFIIPLVRDRLNEGTECIGYEDYFTFYEDFGYNCYDGNFLYGVSVKASSTSDEKVERVEGFRLQFLGGGESQVADVVGGVEKSGEIRMLDSSVDVLEVPSQGGVRTYVYNGGKSFEKIEIYPLLKSGRMCDKSDTINIEGRCDPSVNLGAI